MGVGVYLNFVNPARLLLGEIDLEAKEEKGMEIAANFYAGIIPNTELNGFIVIFKIRDKTAILRTDSVLFEAEFKKLIETITFNA